MDLDASGDKILQQREVTDHHASSYSKVSASFKLNGSRHASKMRDNYTNTRQRVTGGPATPRLLLVLLLQLKN